MSHIQIKKKAVDGKAAQLNMQTLNNYTVQTYLYSHRNQQFQHLYFYQFLQILGRRLSCATSPFERTNGHCQTLVFTG